MSVDYGALLESLRKDLLLDSASFGPQAIQPAALAEVPYGLLSFAADQSIPGPSSGTALTWDAVSNPKNLRGGMVASASGLTVPRAGLYLAAASTWNGGGSFAGGVGFGSVRQFLTINGAAAQFGAAITYVATGTSISDNALACIWPFPANTGDIVGAGYAQNIAGPMTVHGTAGAIPFPNQLAVIFLSNYG